MNNEYNNLQDDILDLLLIIDKKCKKLDLEIKILGILGSYYAFVVYIIICSFIISNIALFLM